MARRTIHVPATEPFAEKAADYIRERIGAATAARGRCTVTLCGGATAPAAYAALAGRSGIPWEGVHFFFGDDRFINDGNEHSNQTAAHEALFSRIAVPAGNIHLINKNAATPAEAAREYAAHLQAFFALKYGELPAFDLCINGMGPDGHTASLFPEAPEIPAGIMVAAVHARLVPWIDRITLTLPVFNNARTVLFLAEGAGKAERIQEVMTPGCTLPAARVDPVDGDAVWMVDAGAGKLIRSAPAS